MNCINHMVRFGGVHGEHMGQFNSEDLFEDDVAVELRGAFTGHDLP